MCFLYYYYYYCIFTYLHFTTPSIGFSRTIILCNTFPHVLNSICINLKAITLNYSIYREVRVKVFNSGHPIYISSLQFTKYQKISSSYYHIQKNHNSSYSTSFDCRFFKHCVSAFNNRFPISSFILLEIFSINPSERRFYSNP